MQYAMESYWYLARNFIEENPLLFEIALQKYSECISFHNLPFSRFFLYGRKKCDFCAERDTNKIKRLLLTLSSLVHLSQQYSQSYFETRWALSAQRATIYNNIILWRWGMSLLSIVHGKSVKCTKLDFNSMFFSIYWIWTLNVSNNTTSKSPPPLAILVIAN